MSGPFGSQQWMYNASSGFYPYELNNSLKFEDGDSAYLSRTPSSASNRTTWTLSMWVKRANISTSQMLFSAGTSSVHYANIQSDNTIRWRNSTLDYETTQVFRDPSAWYHLVFKWDTTNSTAADRAEIYVNNEKITVYDVKTNASSSENSIWNDNVKHTLGNYAYNNTLYFDGYMTEVIFIDGTALDPTSFGETKEGIWIPKDPTGLTYGTNGFRLPFAETTTANGFNTVTYEGTGASQSLNGVGFQPDFVWIKGRDTTDPHGLFDSVRGVGARIQSHSTAVEFTSTTYLSTFDQDGFTVGTNGQHNGSNEDYVAWCWGGGTNDKTYTVTVVDDGGNKYRFDGHGTSSIALNLTEGATYTFNYPSAHPLRFSTTSDGTHGGGSEYTTGVTHVSDTQTTFTVPSGAPVLYYYCSIHSGMGGQVNTNTTDGPTHAEGTILSRVKPNADYGFSIVSYTGSGANATVAHGLSSAPKLILFKKLDVATDWMVYNHTVGNNRFLYLNLTNGQTGTDSSYFNDTDPTDSLIHLGTYHRNNTSSERYIAYCFADVTGHQKIGTYSGTGSSGNAITGLGFKPAWLMVKRTDTTSNWVLVDNTRVTSYAGCPQLYPNLSDAEAASTANVGFDSDGFTINNTAGNWNASGGTYIYLAIADTRDALFTSDASGNGNNWTANVLQHSDVMPDTPTDGFATLNPLYGDGGTTWKEGNLELSTANKGNNTSTFFMESGKWYWEAMGEGYVGAVCAFDKGQYNDSISISGSDSIGYYTNGYVYWGGGNDSTPATYTSSDIIGVALNMDDGQISFYKNNSLQITLNFSSTISRLATEGCYACYNNGSTSTTKVVNFNFGQDSSFNANEIAQGNTDGNGKGDFYYTPPSGYLALCNANLSDPGIDPNAGDNPEDYFSTVLATGNNSTQSITGVGFQPDWVWMKVRSNIVNHISYDSVRGVQEYLVPNLTDAEATSAQGLTSFDSDGFTLGNINPNSSASYTFAAWNWKAGTAFSNSSGTDGATIDSTGSVNTEAGFSIVSYTGDNTSNNGRIAHGLNSAPEMIIAKKRGGTSNWWVYHKGLNNGTDAYHYYLLLNSGAAQGNRASNTNKVWGTANPDANTFGGGLFGPNGAGTKIAYCFHSVDGYSKIGSYTGTGSTDGPFLYTGFRPSWVMIKNASATEAWHIIDSERSPHNVANAVLYPSSSAAESNPLTAANTDFLSNGFKIRAAGGNTNDTNLLYIYIAFAEQPFKYSNAR